MRQRLMITCAAIYLATLTGAAQERTAGDGVYSSAQAMRGQQVFQTSCSACHSTDGIAFRLAQSGSPAGSDELRPTAMDGIRIAVAGAAPAAIPDFALVQVVGCLMQGTESWSLRNATEPVRTREPDAPKDGDTAQL